MEAGERLVAKDLKANAWYQRATDILEHLRDCHLRRAIAAQVAEIENQAREDARDFIEERRDPYASRGLSRKDFL